MLSSYRHSGSVDTAARRRSDTGPSYGANAGAGLCLILRRTFRLDLTGLEDAVVAHPAVGEGLSAVTESVGQGIGSCVDDI